MKILDAALRAFVRSSIESQTSPLVIKRYSRSTQLSMPFQMLIKIKKLKNNFKLSDGVLIMLINVQMPTIVDISTSMSMITSMIS